MGIIANTASYTIITIYYCIVCGLTASLKILGGARKDLGGAKLLFKYAYADREINLDMTSASDSSDSNEELEDDDIISSAHNKSIVRTKQNVWTHLTFH